MNGIKEAEETEEDSISKNLNLRVVAENPEEDYSPTKATGFAGNLLMRDKDIQKLS